jgi:pimeloyl-ACP methyl ester carboxylesterase
MTSSAKRSLCVIVGSLLAFLAAVAIRVAFADEFELSGPKFHRVLIEESNSKAKCESQDDRIFVETKLGTECVAYFITKGFEERRQAVFFFGGDASPKEFNDPAKLGADLAVQKKATQLWADKLKVRYVYVSRVGLQGSSGNHGERRLPKETFVMNAAVDILKAKLGLDDIALAGQSGGGTIAAALLTLGRADVHCDVLGSGATELVDIHHEALKRAGFHPSKSTLHRKMYDPSDHLGTIATRADRRIFALADRSDTVVPFKYQAQFIDEVKAAGHLAKLIEVDGKGPKHHGTEFYSLAVAGACLNEVEDKPIINAVSHGRSWGEQQQALIALGRQYKKWKPPVGPVAVLKTTGSIAE